MNDFTKEELKHIYDALIMLSKLGWVEGDITIRNKIKSMIDNYMEIKIPMATDYE
jgi:hypothetical protein